MTAGSGDGSPFHHSSRRRFAGRLIQALGKQEMSTPKIVFVPVIVWPSVLNPPSTVEQGFLPVSEVSTETLPALVAQHLRLLREHGEPIESTCPLFGGLVLEVGGRRVLYPQCCGDLSDISTWMEVLNHDFQSGFVALSGHPCPEVIRRGAQIEIICQDDDEAFYPLVENPITMSFSDFQLALERANQELFALSQRIAVCSTLEDSAELSDLLVFGEAHRVGFSP